MKQTQLGRGAGVPDNTALLVVGYRPHIDQRKITEPMSAIGRTLLASSSRWDVHRYTSAADGVRADSVLNILRDVDRFSNKATRRLFLLITGEVVDWEGEPALLADPQWQDHPHQTTLPLSRIGQRVKECRSEAYGVVLLVKRPSTITQDALLRLFAPEEDSSSFVVASDWPKEGEPTLLTNLAGVLAGDVGAARSTGVTVQMICDVSAQNVVNTSCLVGGTTDFVWNVPPSGLDAPPSAGGATSLQRPNRPALFEPDDLTGHLLPGRIHIDGILGAGGFAKVYFGRQLELGSRPVAVKVLNRRWDDHKTAVEMFSQEIAAIAQLNSPNVVRIHHRDITVGGRFFYVMERLNGQTLRDRIRAEHRLTSEQVQQIAQGLFSGLSAIAANGVVHRDVKPENIMLCDLDRGGPLRVVLFDFGIAVFEGNKRTDDLFWDGAGTPAYMAPEQFTNAAAVDERTDVFQAGMVILEMLTGWQRPDGFSEPPPIDQLFDKEDWWASFLKKCLADNPEQRFASADQCLSALTTGVVEIDSDSAPKHTSRLLSAYAEKDRFRFFGRDNDAAQLTERILYHDLVVLSAPSGMGKSSLLRASVAPNLKGLGKDVVYISCRTPMRTTLVRRLQRDPALQFGVSPEPREASGDLEAAITTLLHHRQRGLVLILDQVESVLTEDEGVLSELTTLCKRPDLGLSVVIGIRDDALGVLLAHHERIRNEYELFQIGLLSDEAAVRVIDDTLLEHGQPIDSAMRAVVVDALMKDGAELAHKRRWTHNVGIYPPHLQIVVSALMDRLARNRLGDLWPHRGSFPLQALLDDHVESVLNREFDKQRIGLCAALFAELTVDFERRRTRSIDELKVALDDTGDSFQVSEVVETLVRYRILMPVIASDGQHCVEITHDSLLDILQRWVGTHDLGRRRAKEILKYHLHRLDNGVRSVLSRVEILEVKNALDAVVSLDQERNRLGLPSGGAAQLLRKSIRQIRLRVGLGIAAVVMVAALAAGWFYHSQTKELLRLANIGRFPLDISLLDIDDSGKVTKSPITDFVDLNVAVFQPAPRFWFGWGAAFDAEKMDVQRDPDVAGRFWIEGVGGPADIVVSGRHRSRQIPCPPSIVRRADLPGVTLRDSAQAYRQLVIPSCSLTMASMVRIPEGNYLSGENTHDAAFPRREIYLGDFTIDQCEVSNEWFLRFVDSAGDLVGPFGYHDSSGHPDWLKHPKVQISWPEALAFCEWMGKTLPTAAQAEKAGRGGIWLDGDGSRKEQNPIAARRYPSGDSLFAEDGQPLYAVRVRSAEAPKPRDTVPELSPVDKMESSRSVYGVYHLIGNVSEWRADSGRIAAWTQLVNLKDPMIVDRESPLRYMEPSNVTTSNPEQVLLSAWDVLDLDNRRANLGFRCATRGAGTAALYP
ncbi:MAG: SUMF1/EgtB/PvdO family nonheme iron enzyme [Myxococcales bacterium]|nr:SUMF1/EgtB/PvdO family nonheme iron enzyme [Myxococcales bacterium]